MSDLRAPVLTGWSFGDVLTQFTWHKLRRLMMRSESSLQSSRVNTMTSALTTPVLKPTAVRNVLNVVLGDILFKAWYPSFYSEELVGREVERLFVCQWCFKYSKEILPFLAHVVGSDLGRVLG